MIKGYFKRRCFGSDQKFESGEWDLAEHYKSLVDLQKEMIIHDRNIIFVTDPNVEPMRAIIRSEVVFAQEDPKNKFLELYSYRNKGGNAK